MILAGRIFAASNARSTRLAQAERIAIVIMLRPARSAIEITSQAARGITFRHGGNARSLKHPCTSSPGWSAGRDVTQNLPCGPKPIAPPPLPAGCADGFFAAAAFPGQRRERQGDDAAGEAGIATISIGCGSFSAIVLARSRKWPMPLRKRSASAWKAIPFSLGAIFGPLRSRAREADGGFEVLDEARDLGLGADRASRAAA